LKPLLAIARVEQNFSLLNRSKINRLNFISNIINQSGPQNSTAKPLLLSKPVNENRPKNPYY